MFFIQGLLDFLADSSEGSMLMVRPIWLYTCFTSKDQASLVDDLFLTKLIYLKTMENVTAILEAMEVMSTLPSDSMQRMVLKVVLSRVAFFGRSSSIDPSSFQEQKLQRASCICFFRIILNAAAVSHNFKSTF